MVLFNSKFQYELKEYFIIIVNELHIYMCLIEQICFAFFSDTIHFFIISFAPPTSKYSFLNVSISMELIFMSSEIY
jgi:hypothetical protein